MDKESVNFILDSFYWSFSKINTYITCPRQFHLHYIEGVKSTDNFFSEWGTLMHELFEMYFKNQVELFELSDVYQLIYDEYVKHPAPPNNYKNLNVSYFEAGLEYLNNFEGLYNDCKVLGVEHEFTTIIGEHKFVGIIDLVLQKGDDIYVVDHKSKSGFKNKIELKEYLRQLYTYCKAIHDEYGKYPAKLIFNMFRANKLVEHDFVLQEYEETIQWCNDMIRAIYEDIEYNTKPNSFLCNYICGVGTKCGCSDSFSEGL